MQFASQDFWGLGLVAHSVLVLAVVWCPLVAIAVSGLNFHRHNLVFFCELQDSSSNYNFKLIVFHFVGSIRMISLGKTGECRNALSPSLLLGMMLPGMDLPSLHFLPPILSLLLPEREVDLICLGLHIYLIMGVLHSCPRI